MRNDKLLHFEVPTTEKTIQHLVDFFSMFHTMKYYPILFVRWFTGVDVLIRAQNEGNLCNKLRIQHKHHYHLTYDPKYLFVPELSVVDKNCTGVSARFCMRGASMTLKLCFLSQLSYQNSFWPATWPKQTLVSWLCNIIWFLELTPFFVIRLLPEQTNYIIKIEYSR
jgi:hypothetical protein